MPVNYVLSFCKITAASKVFTRNFYLPLLKPVTPKEALRTLRITGKWLLGTKIQHYIPALLNHAKQRDTSLSDYGKLPHEVRRDFKYVTAVIDPENDSHRELISILNAQDCQEGFVYTIEDIRCNLVITAPLELAIRDGRVVDMVISQRNDKIILKMNDSKKIPLETSLYTGNMKLLKGEGATTEEEEKNHHHGQWTMSLAKIFEDKERKSEEWELELQRIIQNRRKQAWEDTIDFDEMIKENVNKLDWKKFEKEARKVIEQISEPVSERHIEMEVEDLELTKNVTQTLLNSGVNQLPTMKEITEVVKNLANAIPHQVEAEVDDDTIDEEPKPRMKRRVSGVKVTLSSGKECFITGQMVHTDDGEIFVPGQTIENEFGPEYAPGITVIMDNKPTLISGLIMAEEEREPMFLPTDSTITSDGQLTFTKEQEVRPKPPPPKKHKHQFKMSFMKMGEPEKIVEELTPEVREWLAEPLPAPPEPKQKKKRKKNAKKKEKPVEIPQAEVEEPKEKPVDIVEVEITPSPEELELERQKQLELERMKEKLLNDGMDDVIASLESKKLKLEQKLEEMRKLCIHLENNLVNYVSTEDAMEIAQNVVEDDAIMMKIVDILLTLTRRSAAFRDKHSINLENVKVPFLTCSFMTEADEKLEAASEKLKILLKTAVVAANDVFKTRPKDQLLALHNLGAVISDTLRHNTELIEELCQLMSTSLERNEICTSIFRQLTQDVRENNVDLLKVAIKNCKLDECYGEVSEKIVSVLEENTPILAEAFGKISKSDHNLQECIVKTVMKQIEDVVTEKSAVCMLQNVVIEQVLDSAERRLKQVINSKTWKDFISEAVIFSKTLGMDDLSENLNELLNNDYMDITNCDSATTDFLKRLAVVQQLTDKDLFLRAALDRLNKHPECGQTDPRIRQLIRLSAAVTSVPTALRNSREIPFRLMRSQNPLAIEDFLVRRGQSSYPVLISRQGLQAVIPRDASRAVMAGRVPYLLIDERGFTNIKPVSQMNGFGKDRHKKFEEFVEEKGRVERSPTPNRLGQQPYRRYSNVV